MGLTTKETTEEILRTIIKVVKEEFPNDASVMLPQILNIDLKVDAD